jgi:ubiquinone/menaquinone biosynthesis C-methylase UbiE
MFLVYTGYAMTTVGTYNEINRIDWLEKTLAVIPSGARILDAGAGEQQFKRFCSHLEYVAQDFAQYDGQGNSSGLQMGAWDQTQLDIICDIAAIPEPDASFDAIMCIEVFEHLPNPILAIKEFARLLKGGGQLIITAPFCSLTHFAPYHYSTGFNSYFYEKHLNENGFEIIELTTNGNFFEYLAQELQRVPWVAEQYCKDRMNTLEKFSTRILLRMLERFSKKDSGSKELLCFGYHVLARKL